MYDLQIELDFLKSDVEFYLDVERFAGKEIELAVKPDMASEIEKADAKYPPEQSYPGRYRPGIHLYLENPAIVAGFSKAYQR